MEISNFDSLKKQLEQLAAIINKFESKAVQLRIVEYVLTTISDSHPSSSKTPDKGKDSGIRSTTRKAAASKLDVIDAKK